MKALKRSLKTRYGFSLAPLLALVPSAEIHT